MRKVDDGKKKKKEKKMMSFLVATNVVASWLLELRPTGMPHTRANIGPPHPTHKHPELIPPSLNTI